MQFLVLQHLDIEPPALIGDQLRDTGHTLQFIHTYLGDALPENVAPYAGIIIMGGPQSANGKHLPYIRKELSWLARRLAGGMPTLGICLGAQLMAKAAGGKVFQSPQRELGWYPVYPTGYASDDALFSGLPEAGLPVFQWHGETFSLPDKASLLLTHPEVMAQAFRLAKGQYGLQFHVEVDAALIQQWIDAGASERAHLGAEGVAALHAATPVHLEGMRTFCRGMLRNWLEQLND